MFSIGRGSNGRLEQLKFNKKYLVDAKYLFLESRLSPIYPLWSAKVILLSHKVTPGILGPQLSSGIPDCPFGGELRGETQESRMLPLPLQGNDLPPSGTNSSVGPCSDGLV